jgi:DNA polymerase-1
LSSSSGVYGIGFNNQNIPKGLIGSLKNTRGELILDEDGVTPIFEGVNCKKLFLPDDDSYVFVNADAKGAEVSIFSAYARDEALIAALAEGMDAHSFFGSKCLNPDTVADGLTGEARRIALASAGIDDEHAWSYDDFLLGKDGLHEDKAYGKRLKKLRDNIKRLVFGMLYGAGYRKIADIAGISHDQAKKIQDLLFKMFPSIRTYMDRVKWELKIFRLAETYFGRRRRFPLNFSSNDDTPKKLIAQAERRLLNFSIQSTNSDIVLMVMCWVAEVVRRDMGGRMLLTVHDSLGFQVPRKYETQVPDLMYEYGTKLVAKVCPWMPVPYRWDVELGPSYGETDPYKKYMAKQRAVRAPELDGYTDEDIQDKLREATEEHPKRKAS